jgi:hypothetical protein
VRADQEEHNGLVAPARLDALHQQTVGPVRKNMKNKGRVEYGKVKRVERKDLEG